MQKDKHHVTALHMNTKLQSSEFESSPHHDNIVVQIQAVPVSPVLCDVLKGKFQ